MVLLEILMLYIYMNLLELPQMPLHNHVEEVGQMTSFSSATHTTKRQNASL